MTRGLLPGLLLSLLLAMSVHAASGQRTIVVPAFRVGDTFTASGCGYTKPEVTLYVYREGDPTELLGGATPAPDGCFTLRSGYVFTMAGPYEVKAFQIKGSAGAGSYNENHPAAYLDFAVAP